MVYLSIPSMIFLLTNNLVATTSGSVTTAVTSSPNTPSSTRPTHACGPGTFVKWATSISPASSHTLSLSLDSPSSATSLTPKAQPKPSSPSPAHNVPLSAQSSPSFVPSRQQSMQVASWKNSTSASCASSVQGCSDCGLESMDSSH